MTLFQRWAVFFRQLHGIVAATNRYHGTLPAPESPVCSPRKAVCAAKDLRGNYLLLQHSPREYSLLAHLKPGSLLVRQGESVRQGQPVAACGNSGNSSEPHLHFQLQDTPDFYTSAGLPIPFSSLRTAPAPNYHRLDPRPHGAETTPPPYLTRGQQVSPLPPP